MPATTLAPRVDAAHRRLYDYWSTAQLERYDRRDFQGHPAMLRWQKARAAGSRLARYQVGLVNILAYVAPELTRRALGVKPEVYAGAVAFFVNALLASHDATPDAAKLELAERMLRLLGELRVNREGKTGWGLPFNWESIVTFPANTPLSYTTGLAGDAYLDFYRRTGSQWALAGAQEAAHFLSTGLNKTAAGDGLGLSYTALDTSVVANTNSLGSAFLLELNDLAPDPAWRELGLATMRFVLSAQQPDGCWFYSTPGTIIDHYHTSMTIQGVSRALQTSAGKEELPGRLETSLRNGMDYHLKSMWDGPVPRHDSKRTYPIEALAPGEALILFAQAWPQRDVLGTELASLLEERWLQTLEWLLPFQAADGTFPTVIHPRRNLRLRSLRWGDAQILRGLALSQTWLAAS